MIDHEHIVGGWSHKVILKCVILTLKITKNKIFSFFGCKLIKIRVIHENSRGTLSLCFSNRFVISTKISLKWEVCIEKVGFAPPTTTLFLMIWWTGEKLLPVESEIYQHLDYLHFIYNSLPSFYLKHISFINMERIPFFNMK